MDTVLFSLLIVSIFIWLSYPPPEPFTDKETIQQNEQTNEDAVTDPPSQQGETHPYLQRSFVTIPESTDNPGMNCPHNYEIANRELQGQFQNISMSVFGYSKNPYIDMTRFVNFNTIKEPLPVNPDFF